MTYTEFLKLGAMNEIAEKLLDILEVELKVSGPGVTAHPTYRFKGYANEYVREALTEFFERGEARGRAIERSEWEAALNAQLAFGRC
jgi:hypothetical protein